MCQECNFTRSGGGKGTREAAGRVEKAAGTSAAVVELAATEVTAAVATATAAVATKATTAGLNLFSCQNLCCGEQDQAVLRAVGGGLPAG